MIETLLIPLQYEYMLKAILVSAVIGGVCAFLSCFITLKGWSLMGDALSHSVVPGVAVASPSPVSAGKSGGSTAWSKPSGASGSFSPA